MHASWKLRMISNLMILLSVKNFLVKKLIGSVEKRRPLLKDLA
jgi:hypothetical protein